MGANPRPLLVLVPLPPTYRGGTEEYAYRLARSFGRSVAVRIVTTTVDPTPDSPPLETDVIPIVRLDARELFQRPLVRGSAQAALRREVEGAGLVQLHMPFPFVERRVVRWANAAYVPVVLTYHMDASLGAAGGPLGSGLVTGAYRSSSARPALRGADRIVSNSRGYAEASPVLSRHLEQIRVIPKGVDPARLGLLPSPPAGRAEPGEGLLPGSVAAERRVLFVGRMVPYKGLPVLLEAVARARSTLPELRLYLAGRGPERPGLEARVARLGLSDTVRFLGFVPDERLGELYRSADVVACPSLGLLESTPTTLEEAAAVGTPILGSDLPGARESLPDDGVHGLLCPPGDAEALARALERLLTQPRPAPPVRIRTWDDVAGDYLALFGELGFGPSAPPSGSPPNPDNPRGGS